MKDFKTKYNKGIANLALSITKLNVNTACTFFAYQPTLPKGAEKLRKH